MSNGDVAYEALEQIPKIYQPGQSYEDFSNSCRSFEGLEYIDDFILEQSWRNLNFSYERSLSEGQSDHKKGSHFLDSDPSEHTANWALSFKPQERNFLINSIIPFVPVGIVAAAGGTGKSFFCLQLAASLASGLPFMNYPVPYSSIGKTVIFNCEDDTDEMHRRLWAIHEIKPETFANPETLSKIIIPPIDHAQDFVLHSTKRPEISKTEQVISYLKKIDNLKLVVFDPANIVFEGDSKDENEVSRFFKHLYRIHNEVGCMILVLNHTTKAAKSDKVNMSEQVMGSVAWVNRSRLVINLKYQDSIIDASITKCNYLSREDRDFKMEYAREGAGVLQPFSGFATFSTHETQRNQKKNFRDYFDFIDSNLNIPLDKLGDLIVNNRVGNKKTMGLVLELIQTGSFSDYVVRIKDEKRYIVKLDVPPQDDPVETPLEIEGTDEREQREDDKQTSSE